MVAFLCGVGMAAWAGDGGYPRADLLMEPSALAEPAALATFVVLDARTRPQFDAGHVAGARWIDRAAWEKAFAKDRDAAAWGARIGGLGVARDRTVVVYDDSLSKDACRIWWILKYWGVPEARVLNGGWTGIVAARLPIKAAAPPVAAVPFAAEARSERFADKALMLGAVRGGTEQIVDARSEKEFCGAEKLKNRRGGAMPGAKLLEWSELLDRDSRRFKSAEELRKLFAAAGIALDRPTATHCQGGGRAAVMAFALELMGATQVRNYYASWSEWGNADDTPIVVPPAKK